MGPGVPDSISVTPMQDTLTVGQTLQMAVSVLDRNGIPLPSSTVTWTSSGGGVANVSSSGLVAALTSGGPVTITARAGGLTASAIITVVTGTPTQLSLATQPSSSGASGVALAQQPVVQLLDAAGNPSPASGVQVTAVVAQGQGTVSNATATTNGGGRATFTGLTITGTGGDYRLRFEANALAPVTSGVVAVIALTPATLAVVTQPSTTAESGVTFPQQPTVEVRDASNSLVGGAVVTATVATGGGTIGGTATATTNALGRATFTNLAIVGLVGTKTLRFTSGAATGTSGNIQLQAGPPAQLVMSTQPSTNASNDIAFAQQPVVQVRDGASNPVGGVNVTASIQSGGGTIGGTTVITTNGSGLATFTNLKITGVVGAHTLRFVNGAIEVTSNTVNLGPGAPASLSILTQPPAFAFSGDVFTRSPVVEVKDVSGNLVGGAQVVASIQSGGGTLNGTTSVTTNGSGVSTFSSLSLSGVGPRTLRFASGTGQSVSSTVDVSYGEGMQTITYCGSQQMDVFVPAESFPRPLPVAVHIHGGAWVSGDRTSGLLFAVAGGDGALKTELLSRGYVVVSLDYRLAPDSQWPAQIHDVKCAIRHLRAKSGDYGTDGRIVVWGSSAGGPLASLLGVTDASSGLEGNEGFSGVSSRVDAVAPIGAISDLRPPAQSELPFAGPEQTFASWPGPSQELIDASPVTWAGSGDPPFYIVHGDQDATVLYNQATRLDTALGNGAELLTVVNGGHNLNDVGMGTPSHSLAQVADLIADFFDDHVLD